MAESRKFGLGLGFIDLFWLERNIIYFFESEIFDEMIDLIKHKLKRTFVTSDQNASGIIIAALLIGRNMIDILKKKIKKSFFFFFGFQI